MERIPCKFINGCYILTEENIKNYIFLDYISMKGYIGRKLDKENIITEEKEIFKPLEEVFNKFNNLRNDLNFSYLTIHKINSFDFSKEYSLIIDNKEIILNDHPSSENFYDSYKIFYKHLNNGPKIDARLVFEYNRIENDRIPIRILNKDNRVKDEFKTVPINWIYL